ncbi:UDP-N-acetylmuramate dehydrogenase [Terriglobus aquaticus]|uniref:UDP-N-acetylenolpyruvoylglucosamine reductase n=1 Tax=Terriglobus aquaticus TaxID=940139 RepID=A0ABW9KHX6_9BACT|nr:UDP-N-acetylmuramate dehydrogenase [Terriglobus aquaticus]
MADQQAPAETSLAVQENVPLAPYTTLGVGGPARWFVSAQTEAEVTSAVAFARERGLPLFVLGGGSNLLVSDAGFPGVVLHIGLRGVREEVDRGGDPVYVTAAAGESWDDLVQFTVDRDLQGMECLAGIPGTVGGTPVQNVGAYGQEIAQTLVSVRCFDTATNALVELTNADLGFGYRTSLLNGAERGRYIVLRVTFALRRCDGATVRPNLSYADLKRAFPEPARPTLIEVAETVRKIRRGKGMVVDAADPDSRSAGSFFRNPIVPADALRTVAEAAGLAESDVPHWPAADGQVKLPAAWLLERAGFVRGTVLGQAGISSKHTLALINRGGATQRDIAALREQIVAGVRQRFGVELEQEPVNVG